MKKVVGCLCMLSVALILLVACGENKADAKMLSGDWEIVSVNGQEIMVENMPFIEFDMDSHKVHGNAGCNIFNSSFTLSDTDVAAITIAPAAATMMACPEMETEGQIFKALLEVAGTQSTKTPSSMALVDKDGKVVLVLVEK